MSGLLRRLGHHLAVVLQEQFLSRVTAIAAPWMGRELLRFAFFAHAWGWHEQSSSVGVVYVLPYEVYTVVREGQAMAYTSPSSRQDLRQVDGGAHGVRPCTLHMDVWQYRANMGQQAREQQERQSSS